ncbi:OmpA family protein [Croceiramulus getboli]|nr:OmpA family protein [Flavobacteriaceae bacterium YJPT1-3]
MKKLLIGCGALLLLSTSCVSAKLHKELEEDYAFAKEKNRLLEEALANRDRELNVLQTQYEKLLAETEAVRVEREKLFRDLSLTQQNLENLQDSYDALESNSSSTLAANVQENRRLLQELEDKQRRLTQERERLEALQRDLADRSARVAELEEVIASKEASMRQLKEAISRALVDFEGKGLTVEQWDGKVYVSLENKLLFESGSWTVGTQGRQAVQQLAAVLAQNPDISVLIEGHTDNVPYSGSGALQDNWDLSTKRATAIVHILEGYSGIDKKNLTAAGRGEFAPIAPNTTPENRAKNRRIEIILTPKLDEITRLINDI